MSEGEKIKWRDFFLTRGSNHSPWKKEIQFILQLFNVFEAFHPSYIKLQMWENNFHFS